MKLKIKKFLKNRDFWLVAIILIYGFYSGLFGDLFYRQSDKEASLKTARIEINYGSEKRAFEGETFPDMSVLDALLAASKGGNFEIRYALLSDNTDIMRIDGLVEDGLGDKTWHFYLNGKEIKAVRIHKTKVKSGDKISINFE